METNVSTRIMKPDSTTQLHKEFAALEAIFQDLSSGHFFSIVGYRRFTYSEYEEWKNIYGQYLPPEEGGFPDSYRKMIPKGTFMTRLKGVLDSAKQFAGIGEDSPQDQQAVAIIQRVMQILNDSYSDMTMVQETFVDEGYQSVHSFVVIQQDFVELFSVQCVID